MTRQECYILLGRVEAFIGYLDTCIENNITPNFGDIILELDKCGDYAEKICAYVMETGDEYVLADCCKLNRYSLLRFAGNFNNPSVVNKAFCKVEHFLFKIHNVALSKIWGVSPADIQKGVYYISTIEGVCMNSTTGQLLPRPSADSEANTAQPKIIKPQQDTDRPEEQEQHTQTLTTTKGKPGRQAEPFDCLIVGSNVDKVKRILHSIIDGKKGKGAVVYISAAVILGIIQRPTFTQFKKEFGEITCKQSYNSYTHASMYSDDEMTGAKNALTTALNKE